MATYVLIHGAWHGSWCWDKVVHLLKGKGHKVEAPDLPGHGKDPTPIQKVSLQAYVDRVSVRFWMPNLSQWFSWVTAWVGSSSLRPLSIGRKELKL